MPSVCVTGAAGFIGFHVSRRLLELGWEVSGVDCLSSYYDVRLKQDRLELLQKHPGFSFHQLDICDASALDALCSRARFPFLVHLAAQPGVRYSLENPRAYIENNIRGFMNILESCRRSGCKHLLFASSSSVYGFNSKLPFSVRDNVDHPVSMYAATKKSNELMAHVYSHLYQLPATGLRFFTVYGPWGRPDMAPFLFTKAILEGAPLQVFNNGELRRDFTYIDDAVESVVALVGKFPEPQPKEAATESPDRSWAPYRIYNIGNHRPVELRTFIAILEQLIGRKAQCVPMPMQAGDVPATYADVSELAEVVGFSPHTPIEVGLRNFVDWYRNYFRL